MKRLHGRSGILAAGFIGFLGACPSIRQILLAKDERLRFQLAA